MAYGITFYKPRTQGFEAAVNASRQANPSLASQIDSARAVDSAGTQSTRAAVLEAFQSTSTAPIIPSETLIRQWMISGLGFKKQTFVATQDSLYNSNPTYAATIAEERAFEKSVVAPLTVWQEDNENGYPSQSTQDSFGNNKTAFLLCLDNGLEIGDIKNGAPTAVINPIPRNESLYKGTLFDGSSDIYTQNNGNLLNSGERNNYSFEAWIYRTTSGREESIVSRIGGSSAGFPKLGLDVFIDSANKVVWDVYPFKRLTSSTTVPSNTWTHIAINQEYGKRIFINGVLAGSRQGYGERLADETVWTRITSFAGSYYSAYNFYNAVTVSEIRSFSLYDTVYIAGYVPSENTSLGGKTLTIVGIDYKLNIINLSGGSVTRAALSTEGGVYLVRTNPVASRSASYRGVIARSVDYPNRIFLWPTGQPVSSNSLSGVEDRDYNAVRQYTYRVGDRVVFSGDKNEGNMIEISSTHPFDRLYYITSVVNTGSFGGYITVSLYDRGVSLNGPLYGDTTFNYFTYNGQATSKLFITKVDYTINGSGWDLPNVNTNILSTTSPYRDNTTTKFIGLFGGARFILGGSAYNSNSTFTPQYPLTMSSGVGSSNLLINSKVDGLPANTGQAALNLGYTNPNNILTISKPNYLGSILYSGSSSYATVAPTGSAENFWIPPGTNWCAEAYIQPLRGQAGGIMGSGTTGTSFWTLQMTADRNLVFNWDNSDAVGTLTSAGTLIPLKVWSHVAVSLNGTNLRLFLNGTIVASTTITARYFKPNINDSKYYLALHAGSYFYGFIATPRLVIGKSIYTSNFTVSTSKPKAERTSVLNAFAENSKAVVIPDEGTIQYWMCTGFDNYSTIQFSSTDITWNQVDSFLLPAYNNTTKTYPFCVGREFLINQTLIGTPDITKIYYASTVTTNSSNGTVSLSGATVDAFITVLMR
jgi:hypothetical protein